MADESTAATLTDAEWISRYKARLIEFFSFTDKEAETMANATSDMRADFPNDPEGAADEEMEFESDSDDTDVEEDDEALEEEEEDDDVDY
jgi:hypothetical protein